MFAENDIMKNINKNAFKKWDLTSQMQMIAILTIFCFVISCSCSPKKIIPEAPDLVTSNYPELPVSYKTKSSVVVPIEISLPSISSRINASIPQRIDFDEKVRCPELPPAHQRRLPGQGTLKYWRNKFDR